jgi:hypothetical protein
MTKLNFGDSVYYGSSTYSCGIELNEDTGIISYIPGILNSSNFVVPVRAFFSPVAGGISEILENEDYIILIEPSATRGSITTLSLPPSPPQGKMIIISKVVSTGTLIIDGNGNIIILGVANDTTTVTSFNIPSVYGPDGVTNYYNAHLLFWTPPGGSGTWFLVKAGGSDTWVYTGPPI